MHRRTAFFRCTLSVLTLLLGAACGTNDAYAWDFSKDTDPSLAGVDFDGDPFFHAVTTAS